MLDMHLRSLTTDHAAKSLIDQPPDVVVVVESFEQRCVGLINWLKDLQTYPQELIVYRYSTLAHPVDLDHQLRGQHREIFRNFARLAHCKYTEVEINPYAANAILASARTLPAHAHFVFDITCMTRIHLAAVSPAFLRSASEQPPLFFYSEPESYGPQQHAVAGGWRDTIFVPIGQAARLRREGHARGIILAGHDAERLSMALIEIEPAAGRFVLTSTPKRPDFMKRTREATQFISERMLTLQMPRSQPSPEPRPQDHWTEEVVSIADLAGINHIMLDEIEAAAQDNGPLFLFPFGPKLMTLAASLTLASAPNIASYLVYPIPHSYDVSYSSGFAKIYCASI